MLALAAPAGWVLAGERSQPYVVLFSDAAVGNGDAPTTSTPAGQGVAALSFRVAASPQKGSAASGRHVDAARVAGKVREIEAVERVSVGQVYSNAVGGFSANLNARQRDALQNDPAVAAVIPDDPVQLSDGKATAADASGISIRTTTHPNMRIPPGIRRIGGGPTSVTIQDGHMVGVNADVAIIDTGIDRTHPDLNVVGGYNCTGRNRNAWDDDDGHGTHVAGIVGGMGRYGGVVGVAPGARLWSVKVLNSQGRGYISWLVCGVDWVTAERDRTQNRPLFEVANMSISYARGGNQLGCADTTDVLHQAICHSIAAGIVYVVAAGNEGHNARLNRPAAYDEVITVGALADYDGRPGGHGIASDSCPYWTPDRDDSFTDFSNYGTDLDLVAPGRCILSTYYHDRYAWMSGTSMATPHVTGAVAVYRSLFPRATVPQVKAALQAMGTLDWRTTTYPADAGPAPKALWMGDFRAPAPSPPSAAFTAPRAGLTLQSDAAVKVAWSETSGGADITGRTLERQVGRIGTPGTCDGTQFATDTVRRIAAATTDQTSAGSCYRWKLTLTDSAGNQATAYSSAVLVDASAPLAPVVDLADAQASLNLDTLGVGQIYVGRAGTIWVRGWSSGTVDLDVTSRDPESGITANSVDLSGRGWSAHWVGGSWSGALRLDYSANASSGTVSVRATNNAGLTSGPTVGSMATDAAAPTPVAWSSFPAGTTYVGVSGAALLSWNGGSDNGSGLAHYQIVRRFRTPVTRTGTCDRSGWVADSPYRLVASGAVDTGLVTGNCYAWTVRTLDNVGNYTDYSVSGYFVDSARTR